MNKYPIALFIGRFQPFHKGHEYSLKKALELAERVIIGIGSSNVHDENNPWDFETRKRMVEAALREPTLRGDSSQIAAIVAVPDYGSDAVWAEQVGKTVQRLGYKIEEAVGVGNNEWTNEWLSKIGMDIEASGLYNRDELEGVKIRRLMRAGKEGWKERVPEGVVEILIDTKYY